MTSVVGSAPQIEQHVQHRPGRTVNKFFMVVGRRLEVHPTNDVSG